MTGWLLNRLSKAFVFPKPEPPIINILYESSVTYGHFGLCSLLFSLV